MVTRSRFTRNRSVVSEDGTDLTLSRSMVFGDAALAREFRKWSMAHKERGISATLNGVSASFGGRFCAPFGLCLFPEQSPSF